MRSSEFEPVVVGREKWRMRNLSNKLLRNLAPSKEPLGKSEQSNNSRIGELDPLETQQVKPNTFNFSIEPPKNAPATRVIRNFEGTLVFKPRKLGLLMTFHTNWKIQR